MIYCIVLINSNTEIFEIYYYKLINYHRQRNYFYFYKLIKRHACTQLPVTFSKPILFRRKKYGPKLSEPYMLL